MGVPLDDPAPVCSAASRSQGNGFSKPMNYGFAIRKRLCGNRPLTLQVEGGIKTCCPWKVLKRLLFSLPFSHISKEEGRFSHLLPLRVTGVTLCSWIHLGPFIIQIHRPIGSRGVVKEIH